MESLLIKTPYCRTVTLLNKLSFADYRFLILKAVLRHQLCLQNLDRFSQIIHWQFVLKLLLCIKKGLRKSNIHTNANYIGKKQKQAINTTNIFPLTASWFPWEVSIVNLQPTYLYFLSKDRGNARLPPDW